MKQERASRKTTVSVGPTAGRKMHPAGDDVFDTRTERVGLVGVSPLSRPDEGIPTARLHF